MVIKSIINDDFGLLVDEASNGAIALQMFTDGMKNECKCQFRAYTLIFMDIAMPVMDGKEASKNILKLVADSKNAQVINNKHNISEEEKIPK